MERMLDVLHQTNAMRLPVTLQFASRNGQVGLYCEFPPELKTTVFQQLNAAYPTASLTILSAQALAVSESQSLWSARIRLRRDVFPFRRHSEFIDAENSFADPVATLLSALPAGTTRGFQSVVEIRIRPCSNRRVRQAKRTAQRLSHVFFRTHPVFANVAAHWMTCSSRVIRAATALASCLLLRNDAHRDDDDMNPVRHQGESSTEAAKDKVGRHLFEATICMTVSGPAGGDATAKRMLREIAGAFGAFSSPRLASFHLTRSKQAFRLSTEEIASLWHPTTVNARASRMQSSDYRT